MRGAAAPRTPRLKRKDTLHAYRVAANATDSFTHVVILDSQTLMGPKGKRNRPGVLLSLFHCLRQPPRPGVLEFCDRAGADFG